MTTLTTSESNILYLGLAGTGKTTTLIEHATTALSEGKNILYLLPHEQLKNETIQKHHLLKDHVHTFHTLALYDLNLLKDGELSSREMDSPYNKSYPNVAYYFLLSWWISNFRISSFTNYDCIILDGLHDLNKEMIDMLNILVSLNEGVKIIAAGDPYQITFYHNEGTVNKVFEVFEKQYSPLSIIEMNNNYRSSVSIQKCLNGYYEKQFNGERFYNLENYKTEQYSDDVFIHNIKKRSDLNNFIKDIVDLYPAKKITILGRFSNEVEDIQQQLKLINYNIFCSRINDYKTEECDVVVLINTILNYKSDLIEEKNLINIAISRAKEKIHIVSLYADKTVLPSVKENTYSFFNYQ